MGWKIRLRRYIDVSNIYSSGYTLSNGICTWTPTNATIDATDSETQATTISGLIGSANSPYSVDPGNWYFVGEYYNGYLCRDGDNSRTCNYITKPSYLSWETYFSTTPFATNGEHGHVGNYYRWGTAIASNNSTDIISGVAENSICPAGWRLPIGGSYTWYQLGSNEFYNLGYLYSNQNPGDDEEWLESPIYMVRAGRIYSNGLYESGVVYNYISSVVVDESSIYLFETGYPDRIYGRINAMSVRCLAK